MNEVLSQVQWKKVTDEAGKQLPKEGVIRFIDSGALAYYQPDILAWSITGEARAWGDPGEILRTFGSYEILDVR